MLTGPPGAHATLGRAFPYQTQFNLSHGRQDRKCHFAVCRRCVDGLRATDKVDTQLAERIESRYQMTDGARKAVKLPHEHSIKEFSGGVGHEALKAGPALTVTRIDITVNAGDYPARPAAGVGF